MHIIFLKLTKIKDWISGVLIPFCHLFDILYSQTVSQKQELNLDQIRLIPFTSRTYHSVERSGVNHYICALELPQFTHIHPKAQMGTRPQQLS